MNGPDGIPGRMLRASAEQLTGVFKDIFNLSLAQAVVPTSFKTAPIVPVPKDKALNDPPTAETGQPRTPSSWHSTLP